MLRLATFQLNPHLPIRVCVAQDCVPCEREPEDTTTEPFVLWVRDLFDYDFEKWDAKRRERAEQKKKIVHVPVERWDDMITSGEITHRMSVMATRIAEAWIEQIKPPSFPRKSQKKKKKMIGSISIEGLDALEGVLKKL